MRPVVALVLACLAAPLLAAPPSTVVTIYATVTSWDGSYVDGLAADDFELVEDKVPRTIVDVSSGHPIVATMILELLAMDPESFVSATETFRTSARPGDRVLPVDIDARFDAKFRPIDSWLRLHEALGDLGDGPDRRAIIVFTGTRQSWDEERRRVPPPSRSPKDVTALALRRNVSVFALTYKDLEYDTGVRKLAEQTGGAFAALPPGARVDGHVRGIFDALHHEYRIQYTSDRTDDKSHPIGLRVRRPQHAVRTVSAITVR